MKTTKLEFNLDELRVFEVAFANYQPLGALEAAVILGSDGVNVVLLRYQNALDLWQLAGAFHRQLGGLRRLAAAEAAIANENPGPAIPKT